MRLAVLLAAGALAATLGGCAGRSAQRVSPSSGPAAPPRTTRVGIVDLEAVAHQHPRWKELDALIKRAALKESELAMAPMEPPISQADLDRMLREEAARLRQTFERELNVMREERTRALKAYSDDVTRAQEAKFAAVRKEMEQRAREELDAKRAELQAELRAAEQAISDEYRYPLLNLRLRAEVAGLRSEEEGRQILRQLQALSQEREERIREKNDETERRFQEIQQALEADVNARLATEHAAHLAEGQRLIEARQRALEAELAGEASGRERAFRERMERRRRELIASAEATMAGRQQAQTRDARTRAAQLQAELAALQQQRARLEDAILADVKIEVAAIAQAQQVDVVVTRYVASRGQAVVELTADVIRRIHR